MFLITFVYENSSTQRYVVEANDVKSALNCIITNERLTVEPKFVVVEKPTYVASETDFDVVSALDSWGGDYANVYTFKNKLAENITVGNVTVKYGSLLDVAERLLSETTVD